MSKLGSAAMPLPIVVSIGVSVLALVVLWISPIVVKFIKRVVAGPGDRVAFRQGLVIRNGPAVAEPYARRCTDRQCELPTAITVPPGTWFLAGDNRGESDDSRFWGPVPTKAVTGIVKYRYWPLGKAGTL